MDLKLDLFTPCTRHSELQVITTLSLIFTIHTSPQHTLSFFQPAVSSPAVSWQGLLTVEILQLPALRSFLRWLSFRNACQLFPQLNLIAISSQPPLQSTNADTNTKPQLSSIITLHGLNRKHRFQQHLYCSLRVCCRGNVFTERRTSLLAPLFRTSGVMSQYIYNTYSYSAYIHTGLNKYFLSMSAKQQFFLTDISLHEEQLPDLRGSNRSGNPGASTDQKWIHRFGHIIFCKIKKYYFLCLGIIKNKRKQTNKQTNKNNCRNFDLLLLIGGFIFWLRRGPHNCESGPEEEKKPRLSPSVEISFHSALWNIFPTFRH
jgi:hypothetical protein